MSVIRVMEDDRTFLSRVFPDRQRQEIIPNEHMTYNEMVEKSLARGPMQEQKEAPELLAKVKKFFRPGEKTVTALVARIGLGPRALLEWSDDRIEKWIAQQDENAKNDGIQEPKTNLVGPLYNHAQHHFVTVPE